MGRAPLLEWIEWRPVLRKCQARSVENNHQRDFMKRFISIAAAGLMAVGVAHADNFTVDAAANSSNGGSGLNTISLTAGESFSVVVGVNDLWSSGEIPRWSNANGLAADLYATGSDESGKAAGTLIGKDYGLFSDQGASFHYGTLVGQIGSGSFFEVGTNYTGVASSAGTLKLFYWDSNSGDNTGSVLASVTAVPEPETYAMFLAGLAALSFMARRRKNV
jgi:hypothetical protein